MFLSKFYTQHICESQSIISKHKPFLKFIKLKNDTYTADKKCIYLNNTKITKFQDKITHFLTKDQLIFVCDRRGEIRILKNKVLKRFYVKKRIISLEVKNSKIYALTKDNYLLVYDFFEQTPIKSCKFEDSLGLIADNDLLIYCKNKIKILDFEFNEIKEVQLPFKHKAKLVVKDRKIYFIYKYKIKVLDLQSFTYFKREFDSYINNFVLENENFYILTKNSLNVESCLYTLSLDLELQSRKIIPNLIDIHFDSKLYFGLSNGNITGSADIFVSKLKFLNFNQFEKLLKKFYYKKAFLLAIKESNFGVLTYLFEMNAYKYLLKHLNFEDVKNTFQFIIINWNLIKTISLEILVYLTKYYISYYDDIKGYIEELEGLVVKECLIQQEQIVLVGWLESEK